MFDKRANPRKFSSHQISGLFFGRKEGICSNDGNPVSAWLCLNSMGMDSIIWEGGICLLSLRKIHIYDKNCNQYLKER